MKRQTSGSMLSVTSTNIHSERWTSAVGLRFLGHQADQRVHALLSQNETPLVVWDERVLEKPERLKLEGLCPVRSPKAVRLKRLKPGYFHLTGGRRSASPAGLGSPCA